MSDTENTLERHVILDMVRVTEEAAIAASKLAGLGNEKKADAAAVEAMRTELNKLDIDGTIVIGEGERDEAPMLYIGEKVGTGKGAKYDIALDPLEGTTLTAHASPNATAVIAFARDNHLLNAPDVYMDKLAIGSGLPEGLVDLDNSPSENVKNYAKARGIDPQSVVVCVLNRPRHEDLIHELREVGCHIKLIPDGDVAGVMAVTDPDKTGVDIYMGSGGAPEGVLAAAALRCIGGFMQTRLLFRNDDERNRAKRWKIEDLDRKYNLEDLASGDVVFAATGVTDGEMLQGVQMHPKGWITTESLVMHASSKTVRRVFAEHRNRQS